MFRRVFHHRAGDVLVENEGRFRGVFHYAEATFTHNVQITDRRVGPVGS